MEASLVAKTKVCIRGLDLMTKMVAMPINGKTLKVVFFRTERPMTLKLLM